MNVADCMTKDVSAIDRDATLVEASHRMLDEGLGFLPVIEDGRLIGVVTDRDLVVRGLAENMSPFETEVDKLMSIEVVCCFADQDVDAARALMLDNDVRRLPVIDREHRLVGIVSRQDLGLPEAPKAKAPVKVTFQKTRTDSYGRQHKVPVRTVYITGVKESEAAVSSAVAHIEKEQGRAWTEVADDLSVEQLPAVERAGQK